MSALLDELIPPLEGATFVLLENGQLFSEAKVAPSRLTSVRRSSLVYLPFDVVLGVRIFQGPNVLR